MIRVSVLYPGGPGKKFDWDYYLDRHLTTAGRILHSFNLVRSEVDKGIGTMQQGAPAPFITTFNMYFNNIEDFQKAMAVHGNELMADIPKFTDIEPQIQVSEIMW